MLYVLTAILSYLIGSIPFAFIIAKLVKGIDIREYGSGNMGATNVWRAIGKVPAITTLLLDVLKGYLPVILTLTLLNQVTENNILLAIVVGVAAIIGHLFPIFLKFKGGKGVAVSLGIFLALAAKAVLICVLVFIIIVYFTRIISVGSIICALLLPVLVWYFSYDKHILIFTIIAGVFIILKHKTNVARLVKGVENKLKI
ncbi:glycerol-3-phosphate 1-O-acyltransferase PlsY [bacterium]